MQSMTGYGKKEVVINNKFYTIEIKTLNNKGTEINLKIHSACRSIEFDIKRQIQQKLVRGSIDCFIYHSQNNSNVFNINIALAKEYYQQIQFLCKELNIEVGNSVEHILKYPEITNSSTNASLSDDEAQQIKQCLNEVLDEVVEFRTREGEVLKQEMKMRLNFLLHYKNKILELKNDRIENTKNNLESKLEQLQLKDKYDRDRFEQELIYYLEKLDITEEIKRLETHCDYFIDTINDATESTKGKKIGFIVQEISREINTLGSKAQNAEIQKMVIMMKDETEKIKEQINNVL